MLERLEAADDPAELTALLEVGDRRLEAPAGDAHLLGGEQPGPGPQGEVERGAGVVGDQRPLGAVEGDVGERARHVERDGGVTRDVGAHGVHRHAGAVATGTSRRSAGSRPRHRRRCQ